MSETAKRVLQAPSAPFFGGLPPRYAGMLRGLTFAVIEAVLEAAAHYLGALDLSQYPAWFAVAIPVITLALTSIAGEIDHRDTTGGAGAPAPNSEEEAGK